MEVQKPEAWLRGPVAGIHPLFMPILFTFTMIREDLARHVTGLSSEEVWTRVGGTSLGFHLKHIAGSVDRLTTYLLGDQLDEAQLRFLRHEEEGGVSLTKLLDEVDTALALSERRVQSLNPKQIYDERSVGRKALPTTVIGLIVHLCEHTQRHLGQAITVAKMLRSTHDV
jgi:hypothetical protein